MSSFQSPVFPTKRLKHIVTLRRSPSTGEDNDRPYVGLEAIESWTGKFVGKSATDDDSSPTFGNRTSLSRTFEPGDVLFGKLRPYLAKVWMAEFPGRCTTEFLVMRPADVLSQYLCYVCLSVDFIAAVDALTFGSRMPRADWNVIGDLHIPIPTISEQRIVSAHLDRQIARLDALVAENERMLGLLVERRRAIIARAVTRGLDPDAPLRDSRVPWLPEIPSDWRTRRIAWLFRERDERGEPDLPLLAVSINTGVSVRQFSDDRIETTASDFNTYKIARRGDVVFNKMRMWQGAVGIAPQDGLVSPDYVVACPTGGLLPQYANLLFRTERFSAECARRSHGIVWDRLRLYWGGFRNIEVPLPSIDAQKAITAHVAKATEKMNALVAAAKDVTSLLRERRAALIAAAVTGRLEVEAP